MKNTVKTQNTDPEISIKLDFLILFYMINLIKSQVTKP